MEVVVAGAGSIGLLLGSYLYEAGINVTFYVRREEQGELLRTLGIRRIHADGSEFTCSVKAVTTIVETPPNALWIVAVKYEGLKDLLLHMEKTLLNSPVLFVQNGMGHIELAAHTEFQNIGMATVEHGALRIDDRTVKHNGIGNLTIAPFRGDGKVFNSLQKAHSNAFPLAFTSDAEQILMRKVLINCMINPLTAVLCIENGELLTNEYSNELFSCLYDELMDAFPEFKAVLPLDSVEAVCNKTARNRSSMLADRLNGNRMEIDTIISAVLRKAEKIGKFLPLLSTLELMLLAIDRKGGTV